MFSKATEYALRATIYIAQKSSISNKLSLADIANAIDSPPSFTAKILQLLTKNNCVINSVRGPNGGFYITDKAKQLQLRKVLEALGDPEPQLPKFDPANFPPLPYEAKVLEYIEKKKAEAAVNAPTKS